MRGPPGRGPPGPEAPGRFVPPGWPSRGDRGPPPNVRPGPPPAGLPPRDGAAGPPRLERPVAERLGSRGWPPSTSLRRAGRFTLRAGRARLSCGSLKPRRRPPFGPGTGYSSRLYGRRRCAARPGSVAGSSPWTPRPPSGRGHTSLGRRCRWRRAVVGRRRCSVCGRDISCWPACGDGTGGQARPWPWGEQRSRRPGVCRYAAASIAPAACKLRALFDRRRAGCRIMQEVCPSGSQRHARIAPSPRQVWTGGDMYLSMYG